MSFRHDVAVVGGCGHVGLPLAIALADAGCGVVVYDVNSAAVDQVESGKMPFHEDGAEARLQRAIGTGRLRATVGPAVMSEAEHLVVVIGTPVDEHLNPDPNAVGAVLDEIAPHMRDGQLIVLRSTVFPGVSRLVHSLVVETGRRVDVSFCPERIAQGKAFTELYELPQIVSGFSPEAVDRASRLFRRLTDDIVVTSPEEAELAKLFTNTWRYVKFAAANQFLMMANDAGVDYERVRHAISYKYPRAADLPGAGFAAGPCLLKDTMQLAAFNNNQFVLGHAAMLVNEGLPLYLVSSLERRFDLASMTVGILGMAFKAESDDTRSSLAYKLKRLLRFKAKRVLTTDPYVTTDPDLDPLDRVLEESDILVVAAPHRPYRSLAPDVPFVDVWNALGGGARVGRP